MEGKLPLSSIPPSHVDLRHNKPSDQLGSAFTYTLTNSLFRDDHTLGSGQYAVILRKGKTPTYLKGLLVTKGQFDLALALLHYYFVWTCLSL